ncbi:MAG TPA: hypothetical protein VLM42_05310 [Bryobacteraceae bacterium]|nr:hypothetical protein [Bryobacteraceae bacterium]
MNEHQGIPFRQTLQLSIHIRQWLKAVDRYSGQYLSHSPGELPDVGAHVQNRSNTQPPEIIRLVWPANFDAQRRYKGIDDGPEATRIQREL